MFTSRPFITWVLLATIYIQLFPQSLRADDPQKVEDLKKRLGNAPTSDSIEEIRKEFRKTRREELAKLRGVKPEDIDAEFEENVRSRERFKSHINFVADMWEHPKYFYFLVGAYAVEGGLTYAWLLRARRIHAEWAPKLETYKALEGQMTTANDAIKAAETDLKNALIKQFKNTTVNNAAQMKDLIAGLSKEMRAAFEQELRLFAKQSNNPAMVAALDKVKLPAEARLSAEAVTAIENAGTVEQAMSKYMEAFKLWRDALAKHVPEVEKQIADAYRRSRNGGSAKAAQISDEIAKTLKEIKKIDPKRFDAPQTQTLVDKVRDQLNPAKQELREFSAGEVFNNDRLLEAVERDLKLVESARPPTGTTAGAAATPELTSALRQLETSIASLQDALKQVSSRGSLENLPNITEIFRTQLAALKAIDPAVFQSAKVGEYIGNLKNGMNAAKDFFANHNGSPSAKAAGTAELGKMEVALEELAELQANAAKTGTVNSEIAASLNRLESTVARLVDLLKNRANTSNSTMVAEISQAVEALAEIETRVAEVGSVLSQEGMARLVNGTTEELSRLTALAAKNAGKAPVSRGMKVAKGVGIATMIIVPLAMLYMWREDNKAVEQAAQEDLNDAARANSEKALKNLLGLTEIDPHFANAYTQWSKHAKLGKAKTPVRFPALRYNADGTLQTDNVEGSPAGDKLTVFMPAYILATLEVEAEKYCKDQGVPEEEKKLLSSERVYRKLYTYLFHWYQRPGSNDQLVKNMVWNPPTDRPKSTEAPYVSDLIKELAYDSARAFEIKDMPKLPEAKKEEKKNPTATQPTPDRTMTPKNPFTNPVTPGGATPGNPTGTPTAPAPKTGAPTTPTGPMGTPTTPTGPMGTPTTPTGPVGPPSTPTGPMGTPSTPTSPKK